MNPARDVRIVPAQPPGVFAADSAHEQRPSYLRLGAPLRRAIMKTRQWLLRQQHRDGYWCGELQGDTILESEYILLLAWLGRERSQRAKQAARYLVEQQLPSGGWSLYPGGDVEISASVKAYFALKLTGHDPNEDHMQRARAAILARGGGDQVNSFTRFYLALLGQISYDHCPAVPPEMVLLPTWLPVNLYRISAWSRAILVPLSIMWAHRPVRKIEPCLGIRELMVSEPHEWPELRCPGLEPRRGFFTWDGFFRRLDRVLKWVERRRLTPLRSRAVKTAETWMIDRFADSDGLGAIFPPMIWSIVALKCLGYADDSVHVRYCHEQLEELMIVEGDAVRLQPCKSPVWDTAIALRALAASGLAAYDGAVARAVDWLLAKEVGGPGDWAKTVRAEPGGWFFEHRNEHYPDLDDTAMVLMALDQQFRVDNASEKSLPPSLQLVAETKAGTSHEARRHVRRLDKVAPAVDRGRRWMLAMQNHDGGWGAFDKNNDRQFLCHVPFADHNAMIDPSTPDMTGRVLESLGRLGWKVGQGPVDRAVAYLRRAQEPNGSWIGRWGVNYVYGTWQSLAGLAQVDLPRDDSAVIAGANWLLSYQQSSGGWGESPDSYAEPSLRGRGPVTASQTSWALLGLMAAGLHQHPAVARGIRYLLTTQQGDGTWDETQFTGTGFPQVFYLRYHLYPIYFPLMALSAWAVSIGSYLEKADDTVARLADAASMTADRDSSPP